MNSVGGCGCAVMQLCDFCGCRQFGSGRCSSCGAASACLPCTVINRDSSSTVGKEANTKNYLIHFSVALLAALFAQICTMSDYQFRRPFSSSAILQDTADGKAQEPLAFDTSKLEVEYSTVDLKHQLDAISSKYEIYYAGLNRAATPARSVELNMQKTSADIVLVLSSFKSVHWHLSNPHAVNILAIVYASEIGVSSVTGDLASALVLRSKRPLGTYYQSKQCNCFAPGVYQCAGNDLQSTVQRVESLGRGRVTGIASGFSAVSLRVPQTMPGKIFHRDMKQRRADEVIKSRCFKQTSGKSSFFTPVQAHPAQ